MNGITCSQLGTVLSVRSADAETGLSLSKQLLGSTYSNRLRGEWSTLLSTCKKTRSLYLYVFFFLLDCAECLLGDAQVTTNLSLLSPLQ